MNKPQKIITWFFIVAVIVIALLFIIYLNKPKNLELPSGIILYYGDTCPHCKNVEDWMTNNSILSKINITQKEVFENATNQVEITKVFNFCKIPTDQRGVPLLYANQTCYSGETEVIDFLKLKTGAA